MYVNDVIILINIRPVKAIFGDGRINVILSGLKMLPAITSGGIVHFRELFLERHIFLET